MQVTFQQKTLVINRKLCCKGSLSFSLSLRYQIFHNHVFLTVYFDKRNRSLDCENRPQETCLIYVFSTSILMKLSTKRYIEFRQKMQVVNFFSHELLLE